ncbi:hypothetical protein ACFOW4_07500 [Micromonospora sp. GCM10011542]|uniref:hypothetical protein n=1 Tax=Micromonospora sp. GCM10011542 TaxID=3317337 RepID=UPI00360D4918
MPAKRTSKPRTAGRTTPAAYPAPTDVDRPPVPPVVPVPDLPAVDLAAVEPPARPAAPTAGPPLAGGNRAGGGRSQRAGQTRRYAFRRS